MERDFWSEGCTVEKLGLAGFSVEQIKDVIHFHGQSAEKIDVP